MNNSQLSRYAKLQTDSLYYLGKIGYKFDVSGSTKNVYTVMISLENKTISCNCPDSFIRAKKQACICKHCLFILYRVLRIFNRTDHLFFTTLQFTDDELTLISIAADDLNDNLVDSLVDDHLTARYKNLVLNKKHDTVLIRSVATDLCGVCFLELGDATMDTWTTCKKCGKAAHQECIKKWLSSGQNVCVYCRQVSLSSDKSLKYTNLEM